MESGVEVWRCCLCVEIIGDDSVIVVVANFIVFVASLFSGLFHSICHLQLVNPDLEKSSILFYFFLIFNRLRMISKQKKPTLKILNFKHNENGRKMFNV